MSSKKNWNRDRRQTSEAPPAKSSGDRYQFDQDLLGA